MGAGALPRLSSTRLELLRQRFMFAVGWWVSVVAWCGGKEGERGWHTLHSSLAGAGGGWRVDWTRVWLGGAAPEGGDDDWGVGWSRCVWRGCPWKGQWGMRASAMTRWRAGVRATKASPPGALSLGSERGDVWGGSDPVHSRGGGPGRRSRAHAEHHHRLTTTTTGKAKERGGHGGQERQTQFHFSRRPQHRAGSELSDFNETRTWFVGGIKPCQAPPKGPTGPQKHNQTCLGEAREGARVGQGADRPRVGHNPPGKNRGWMTSPQHASATRAHKEQTPSPASFGSDLSQRWPIHLCYLYTPRIRCVCFFRSFLSLFVYSARAL